jgi:hypothetical protein
MMPVRAECLHGQRTVAERSVIPTGVSREVRFSREEGLVPRARDLSRRVHIRGKSETAGLRRFAAEPIECVPFPAVLGPVSKTKREIGGAE